MSSSNHQESKSIISKQEYQLFVADNSIISQRAIKNCQVLLEKYLKDKYSLTIVDVYKEPEKTLEANIINTPALVRKIPLPELTIIGDLSDLEKAAKDMLLN